MFTIGEFARRSGISPRMLRYYNEMGLLCPIEIGENGYRRYDPAQLASARQIETLKSYGFSLSEIRALRSLPAPELAQRISRMKADAEKIKEAE